MTNQPQHEGQASPPDAPEQAPVYVGAARRRFARKGAAALGAVLTLKSTPGMALMRCSPSGNASGNISHGASTTCALGRSPGYYYTHTNCPGQWYCATTTPFGNVFTCTRLTSLKTMTMFNIIKNKPDQVARHCIAAYQNAMMNLTTTFLPDSKVKEIWKAYDKTGYYSPVTGVVWNAEQIIAYLTKTMS